MRKLIGIVMICMGSAAAAGHVWGQVRLQTDDLTMEVSKSATLTRLVGRATGVDYSAIYESLEIHTGRKAGPISAVYRGARVFPAAQIKRVGNELHIFYGGINVHARLQVIRAPRYLALKLVGIEGDPVDRIDLLQLRVKKLADQGVLINVNFDSNFGVCLCAGNVRTRAGMTDRGDYLIMRATAENDVGLIGATAVLFGTPAPSRKFLDVMEVVERDFGLPSGVKYRRSSVGRYSYLWPAKLTPDNVERYISIAQLAGFRMIMLSYASFSPPPNGGPGHFKWGRDYPRGMVDLKQVTDAIRQAGLKVGLHIHYNKATIGDADVTPVPDPRLHSLRRFTLTQAVDTAAGTLAVAENPGGSPLDDGMRILRIGRELIAYRAFTTTPPYQFTGCRRGHLGTKASGHALGAGVNLLDVDTWTLFIRYDQKTDIQDETARRLATIYKQTGPYECVYFDGAEDVHAPVWFHAANAQYRVFRLLDPAPPACEAAVSTHFSWHMIPRGNAWDVISDAEGMKDFCDVLPCRSAPAAARGFRRIDFGWVGHCNRIEPDGIEYLMSCCAAWDCHFSLRPAIPDDLLKNNPRSEDCLDVIRIWEDARVDHKLTTAQCNALKNVRRSEQQFIPCTVARRVWQQFLVNPTPTQSAIVARRHEHHLFVNEHGKLELVEVTPVPVAKEAKWKASLFTREATPGTTYALIWAVGKPVTLQLPIQSTQLAVMRPFGQVTATHSHDGQTRIDVSRRMYVALHGVDREQARNMLSKSVEVQRLSEAK